MATTFADTTTLWELVERRADATPDALLLIDESGRTLTCGEFRDRALRAAAYQAWWENLPVRLDPPDGPDLVVYLTKQPADAQAVGDDYLDLGVLKGNVGNQNYEVPAGVDLSEYDSVVIWCRRFAVSFGA